MPRDPGEFEAPSMSPMRTRHCLRMGGEIFRSASLTLILLVGCGETGEVPVAPDATRSGTASGNVAAAPLESVPESAATVQSGRIDAISAAGPLTIVPALHDFGAVSPGSINQGSFAITNGGARAVRILKITPSCVCTTLSDLQGRMVAAGETVRLDASLDAPLQPGEKSAKVFVQLEGMSQPAIVELQGMVTLPIQPQPAFASALQGTDQGSIRLRSIDGRPFNVVASNGGPPAFVGFDPAKDEARNAYEIRWSIKGMDAGSIPKWWVFTTDRSDCPIVPCRVRNENTGSKRDPQRFDRRWIVLDDLVDLGRIAPGETRDVRIQLDYYNPRGRGVVDKPEWRSSLAVRSLDPAVEASLVSGTPVAGDQFDVVIRLRIVGQPTSLLSAGVEVSTTTGSGILDVIGEVSR